MAAAIELINITKSFPGIIANDQISFSVEKGEIHAIAGENGAGKTTLMNIIFGLTKPTSGNLKVNGQKVLFETPRDAINAKIGMVHQHFMLIPKMNVIKNVILGDEPGSWHTIDIEKAAKRIREISEKFGLNIDPYKKVGDLSVPEQQRVEILKVLYRNAEILIFDEPTAVLPPQLINDFCEILLGLKKQGKTILFISHKLAEVMMVSDKVTVIRLGKVIDTKKISETSSIEITEMMVGRSVNLGRKSHIQFDSTEKVLEIKDLNYTNFENKKKLNNLNFCVKKGEIVGVAGVDGNGQEELEQCILGLINPDSGSIKINEKEMIGKSIRFRKDSGLGYVAEDRQRESLVLKTSVSSNMILGQHYHKEFAKNNKWLLKQNIINNANKLKKQFDIRCVNINVNSGTLSGGNQQKIVIAREINNNPEVFIAIQPTRGLDVGASETVQEKLMDIRNQGKGVLLISMELDELLAISDRIIIIYNGQITKTVDGDLTNKKELGRYMLGADKQIKKDVQK